MLNRVVVTGMGAVSPLGPSSAALWDGLLSARSGVKEINDASSAEVLSSIGPWTPADFVGLPMSFAGVVSGVDDQPEHSDLSSEERRREPRFVRLALLAAMEAVSSAQLECAGADVGVAFGAGMGSVRDFAINAEKLRSRGARRVDPLFVPKVLPNSAAGAISRRFDFRGPCHAVSTACATGANAIGDAFNFIRLGMAQAMLAGGTDATVDPLSIAGFAQLRALAPRQDAQDVVEASRPFDESRSGFVMGEGAGALVLEEREAAIKRGARILAEVVGYGVSGDAYHVTAPAPDGHGAIRAMQVALRDVPEGEVAYLNAHATSTPVGDLVEAQAIEAVFGGASRENKLLVSSAKGHLGHLLGGAGAVEAVIAIQALINERCPPTLNLNKLDPEIERLAPNLDFVRSTEGVSFEGSAVMSNSFGFGGKNVALVFRRHP